MSSDRLKIVRPFDKALRRDRQPVRPPRARIEAPSALEREIPVDLGIDLGPGIPFHRRRRARNNPVAFPFTCGISIERAPQKDPVVAVRGTPLSSNPGTFDWPAVLYQRIGRVV